MEKILSLFSSQQQAAAVVNALTDAEVNTKDIEIIESITKRGADAGPSLLVAMHPSMSTGMAEPPVANVPASPLQEFNLDANESRFLQRSIQEGGVLVVVKTKPETITTAQQIVQDHGGRVSQTV